MGACSPWSSSLTPPLVPGYGWPLWQTPKRLSDFYATAKRRAAGNPSSTPFCNPLALALALAPFLCRRSLLLSPGRLGVAGGLPDRRWCIRTSLLYSHIRRITPPGIPFTFTKYTTGLDQSQLDGADILASRIASYRSRTVNRYKCSNQARTCAREESVGATMSRFDSIF
ncbi:uncharacterized protein LY79DRAFT_36530 [Colletotrichum navitas]|uniref:Uncharacterized protein n=1 Tax=Colletotrichum navitas TaxID=681940 RepID=A0AAD8Q762_9PEZI|nr:uncharacterized protein LY79DRAFT_36530 [Colletotrichum navitas]KAK1596950.1 hypothetical protein LY79DRAFT_36530 [Colletotrichum navitas]